MGQKLFFHRCLHCEKTYYSPEEDKLFCSSSHEGKYTYRKAHGFILKTKPKKDVKPEEETFDDSHIKAKIAKAHEKWINKKDPNASGKRRDIRSIMFYDMRKPFVPRSLRVMRG